MRNRVQGALRESKDRERSPLAAASNALEGSELRAIFSLSYLLRTGTVRDRAPEKARGWSGESPLLCGEEPCGIEP